LRAVGFHVVGICAVYMFTVLAAGYYLDCLEEWRWLCAPWLVLAWTHAPRLMWVTFVAAAFVVALAYASVLLVRFGRMWCVVYGKSCRRAPFPLCQ
jgi:hypothetical protein